MKLDNKKTLLVGFAFLAICSFWQLYDNIVPLILKYVFNVGDTMSGVVMSLDNIFALFLLPFFGALSDKVSSKWGKRTPFIFCGSVAAAILLVLLPITANLRTLIGFVIALLLVLVAMGTYRSPAVSLMPDVTPKPLRSKANAIINLMGAVGGIIVLALIKILSPKENDGNYLPLCLVVSGIILLALVVLLLTIKENKLVEERIETEKKWGISEEVEENEKGGTTLPKDVKKSLSFILISVSFWFMAYNAVTTAFSKYATEVWGMAGGSYAGALMIGSIGAIVAYIPVGIISSKIGRKKVILFGVTMLAACFAVGALFKTPNLGVYGLFFLVGLAWASINVNSYPMVVEMCKGSDIGKFTGMYYTFSMAAQVVTPILSGFLLEHVGYWTLFPYATIFAIIAFVTMSQVKHGDSKPLDTKKGIEKFADMDMD